MESENITKKEMVIFFTEKTTIERQLNDSYNLTAHDKNLIAFEYMDGNDFEAITIEKSQNEYGVIFYNLFIEYAKLDNEIINCQSCHECSEDCPYFDEPEKSLEHSDKIVERIEKQEPMISKSLAHRLEIRAQVKNIRCMVDIPHEHLYAGKMLELETQSFSIVLSIVHARDLIMNMPKLDLEV